MISYMISPCAQRREPLFPAFYAVVLVLSLMLLASTLLRHAHGADVDGQRAAIVRMGTEQEPRGSGVCVSPDGVILTAAHCVLDPRKEGWVPVGTPRLVPVESIAVRFPDGREFSGRVIKYATDREKSDLAVVKIEARGARLPWLPVARRSPAVGEQVVSKGYPSNHYARLESKVVGVGQTKGEIDGIETDNRANQGHSGGPLLNGKGEVVGICSRGSMDLATPMGPTRTPHYTIWVRAESIQSLLAAAGVTLPAGDPDSPDLAVLHVFSGASCIPCKEWERDKATITIKGVPLKKAVKLIEHDFEQERPLAQTMGVDRVPTFVMDDGHRLVGYSQAGLIKFLEPYTFTLGGATAVTPAPAPAAAEPQVPPRAPDDIQEADTEGRGAGLRAVVLVRKQPLAAWQAAAAYILETQAQGIVTRRLNEALGTRADVELVFERINPSRFAALAAYIGLPEDKPVAVIVSVQKSYEGPGETIVKYVEEKLDTISQFEWKAASVELVFERTDLAGFEELEAALNKVDTPTSVLPGIAGGWLTNLFAAISTLFGGIYTGTRRYVWRT